MNKKVVVGLLSCCLISLAGLTACKETKEVKVEENVNSAVTPTPQDNKNVNVDVDVQQPGNSPTDTKQTDVVVVDKNNKDIATLNTNIQKLQDQIKTANEETKANLNKQIAQMNSEKAKLQQQINQLQIKNQQAQEKNEQAFDTLKQQYRDSVSTKLDNYGKKIDELKTKLNDLNDMDKTAAENDISKLDDSKTDIEKRLPDIDGAPDQNKFNLVKKQIDNMLTDWDKKYNELDTTKLSQK